MSVLEIALVGSLLCGEVDSYPGEPPGQGIARYLGDEAAARDQALGQVAQMLQSLPALIAAAGLKTTPPARGRGRT